MAASQNRRRLRESEIGRNGGRLILISFDLPRMLIGDVPDKEGRQVADA